MKSPPIFSVMLAGFAAFLDLYSTQPLLPMLARTFHASRFAVSLTVTAPTMAVALAAPFVGRLADRLGLRTVIVGSAFGLAIATLLAATATDLRQLIAWRFAQGLATPGLFATAIAYIHEEWPRARVGRATAAYVSGTVIGGITGRLLGGVMAADVSWASSFVVLGLVGVAAAAALWVWLPRERRRASLEHPTGSLRSHLRHPQLLATYAVGFCMLCTQVAMFTYVPFRLAAPPFSLSTAALGLIFLTYVVGAVVTPFAGRGIDAYGHRVVLVAALALCATGALMTLAPSLPVVAAGLSLFASGVVFRAGRVQQPRRPSRRARARPRARPVCHLLLPGGKRRRRAAGRLLGSRRLARLRRLPHRRRDDDVHDCVAILETRSVEPRTAGARLAPARKIFWKLDYNGEVVDIDALAVNTDALPQTLTGASMGNSNRVCIAIVVFALRVFSPKRLRPNVHVPAFDPSRRLSTRRKRR